MSSANSLVTHASKAASYGVPLSLCAECTRVEPTFSRIAAVAVLGTSSTESRQRRSSASDSLRPTKSTRSSLFASVSQFRVLPRPGESLYDKSFSYMSKTKAAAWKDVISFCKKPVIPSTSKNFIK